MPFPVSQRRPHSGASSASVLQQGGIAQRLLWLGALGAILAGGWAWQNHTSTAAPVAAQASGPASEAGGPGGPGRGGRRGGPGNRVQAVSVATARTQDLRFIVGAIGTITPANIATVRAQVDGELKSLHFREGQEVKAGQLLAQLDDRSFQIALANAQGQLERDQAQLLNAELDRDRFKDLLARNAIAKQQVDTQEALVQQLRGTVRSDQARVDDAKLQLSRTRITAPIAGLAGLKQVDLGNQVKAADAKGIVTIAQTHPVDVVFAVPDVHLPRIQARLAQGAKLSVQAWDRERQHKLAQGLVAALDNSIDSSTATIKVKARFANEDGALYPNQFVNIDLLLDTEREALAVPVAAVQRGTQGNFVYVVGSDATVAQQRVQAGVTDAEWVGVKGELNAGDRVVVDGADRLRDGAKVEVISPDKPREGRGGREGREGRGGREGREGRRGPPKGEGAASGAGPAL